MGEIRQDNLHESLIEELTRTINNDFYISVKEFGAVGDGVTDDTIAFKQCIEFAKTKYRIFVPQGEYLITEQLNFSNCFIEGYDMLSSVIKFNLNNNNTNCIIIDGYYCPKHTIKNITLNANYTGKDLLVIYSADKPLLEEVELTCSYRDSLVLEPVNEYQWVENLMCKRIHIGEAGRHAIRFSLGKNVNNFINECKFLHCEIRGVGRKFTDSNAIYAESAAPLNLSGGSKISMMSFDSCNFDVSNGEAINNGNVDLIHCRAIDGGVANFESWKFLNGGYESVNGVCKGYIFNIEDGVLCPNWHCTGIVRYNFYYWYTDALYKREDVFLHNLSDAGCVIPEVDRLNVKDMIYTIDSGSKRYAVMDTIERLKIVVLTDQYKTQEVTIPIQILDKFGSYNSTATDLMLYGEMRVIADPYFINGDGGVWEINTYDFFFHTRDWMNNHMSAKLAKTKSVGDGSTTITVNSLTLDIENKSLIMNYTTGEKINFNGSEERFYVFIDIYGDVLKHGHYWLTGKDVE